MRQEVCPHVRVIATDVRKYYSVQI